MIRIPIDQMIGVALALFFDLVLFLVMVLIALGIQQAIVVLAILLTGVAFGNLAWAVVKET